MSARRRLLITPDISGKIDQRRGEGRPAGLGPATSLFQIDPVPFRLALAQARAKLDDAKTSHDNLVANVKLYGADARDRQQPASSSKQRDVERKSSLVKSNVGSQLDLDNAATALVTAQAQLQLRQACRTRTPLNATARQSRSAARAVPGLLQAKAALDDAQRNLDLTTVCARR